MINITNVVTFIKLAYLYDEQNLFFFCVRFIRLPSNFNELINNEEFMQLDAAILEAIDPTLSPNYVQPSCFSFCFTTLLSN